MEGVEGVEEWRGRSGYRGRGWGAEGWKGWSG